MMQCIGTMSDDNAIYPVLYLLANGNGQFLVLLRPMFSLNTAKSFSVSRLQMSASSGTAPYSSPERKQG
jgi:hypothetical protein